MSQCTDSRHFSKWTVERSTLSFSSTGQRQRSASLTQSLLMAPFLEAYVSSHTSSNALLQNLFAVRYGPWTTTWCWPNSCTSSVCGYVSDPSSVNPEEMTHRGKDLLDSTGGVQLVHVVVHSNATASSCPATRRHHLHAQCAFLHRRTKTTHKVNASTSLHTAVCSRAQRSYTKVFEVISSCEIERWHDSRPWNYLYHEDLQVLVGALAFGKGLRRAVHTTWHIHWLASASKYLYGKSSCVLVGNTII